MQQLIKLAENLADAFDRVGLSYAFGGALANNFWGVVRTTADVDCLVAIPALDYQRLADELNTIGCEFCDPGGVAERVTVAKMRQQADQHKFIALFCESVQIELFVPAVSLQSEILRRAAAMPLENRTVPITTAEDLVLLKLAFHRPKDLQDVKGILWVQQGQLDVDYMKMWSTQMLSGEGQTELEQLLEEYNGPE